MTKQFDPKRVLRLVSNHLLNDLFFLHHHELDVPWEELTETQINPVFEAWQALPEAECRRLEIVFHEIDEMATEDGVKAIVEEAIHQNETKLVEDLDGLESRHDKAVWTFLQTPAVWDLAVRFARADSLSRMRYWKTRIDIPSVEPNTGHAGLSNLQEALSAFFRVTQSRGRYCRVEHYARASGVDYFFCYLEDYADTYVNFDEEGEYARTPERRAFELVFAYSREFGTLDMFVRGGKKVYVPLQEIFCRVILGAEIGPENRESHPYELNGLLDREFRFPTEPSDGVDSVRVRKMRLSIKGMPRRRITLEADPQGNPDDIYLMLEEFLNRNRLPVSILNVTQVGLKFEFNTDREDLPKSLSFDLSFPNSSNLKSKSEKVREIGEKYLKEWGLDRAASHQNASAAS